MASFQTPFQLTYLSTTISCVMMKKFLVTSTAFFSMPSGKIFDVGINSLNYCASCLFAVKIETLKVFYCQKLFDYSKSTTSFNKLKESLNEKPANWKAKRTRMSINSLFNKLRVQPWIILRTYVFVLQPKWKK